MTTELALFLAIVCNIGMFILFVLTNKTTPEERDAMLNDDEVWP